MDRAHIRNFCIIAHIDHGKSTLADRMLEMTQTLTSKQMQSQVLDSMDLERERGITIKAHAVRMHFVGADGVEYQFNLIDTPGHVDFTYEVSRSLAACEGAILVVDAAQGVEAQTVSNLLLAMGNDLDIIPCINKIDMIGAEVERVENQLIDLIGCERDEILRISARDGIGVEETMQAVVDCIPAPAGDPQDPLRCLVFDSLYDQYRGVICFIRVVDGGVAKGDRIKLFSTGREYEIEELGIFRLQRVPTQQLSAGEVGYIIANIKDLAEARVGDTVLHAAKDDAEPLAGYQALKPMVFSGIYPVDSNAHAELRDALEKLKLNDAAFSFEPETSDALGFGFRCGFLGLLHMEIVQERLEREYEMDIIATLPNVRFEVEATDGAVSQVENPSHLPPVGQIKQIREPILDAQVLVPSEYIGNVMSVCNERRGVYLNTEYLNGDRAILHYELPLGEVVVDFYDRIKSVSRGYASFDYEHKEMRPGPLVRLDILINGDPLDALAVIIHRDKAFDWGRRLCAKLKELIPRQMFEVAIQAAIGNKVISRETVKPFRKNVTAKCYGGDVSRKRKLLERQKEGKKRMKQVGSVEIPQEAFLAALQMEE
ncbi:MAG: elongation factor 4 [Gemmatimonadetes bacterium]|jgi:GTP-binding protein LepA|nr:elongation factor 4 [Gemmatimonadota bacterium]MBT5057515.1 elongation factor 4 [Gemmatimonadota bacterium]MBT5146732.1 elongation factor 4 [Gemmatimonadota bacterium]MBT5588582.1 elongation factor 4 [Gemmatimonadota bacterium]MBT5962562.1 elongation factor 4 [Gemmatimonadota bacterium]